MAAAAACEVPLRADAAAAAKPKAEAEAGANGGARCARCKGYATVRRSSDPMRRPQTTTTSASRGSQSTTLPRLLSFRLLHSCWHSVCGVRYLTVEESARGGSLTRSERSKVGHFFRVSRKAARAARRARSAPEGQKIAPRSGAGCRAAAQSAAAGG